MKKSVRFLSIITIICMLITGIHTVAYAASTMNFNVTIKYDQSEARKMLSMINEFRTSDDAWCWDSSDTKKENWKTTAITYDYNLEKIAMQRAAEIALMFSHSRPDGSSCFSLYPQGYYGMGENIAAGQGSAEAAFISWQETNDPYAGQGHRRNMLNSGFKAVGIGHAYYNGIHYWVQEFSDRNLAPTKTSAVDTNKTVSIDILDSYINNYTVDSVSSLKVSCNQSVSLPKVNATVSINGSWPGYDCPIKVSANWKSANTAYAKISNNKLVGVKTGKTSLTTTVLGKKVSVPVSVNPKTPTGFKQASQTTTTIKLSWSKSSDVTGYKVYQYNSSTKSYKKIATTKSTSYTIKNLNPGTTYKFKLFAYKSVSGKDHTSNSRSLSAATKPSAPKITKITTSSKKVYLQWNKKTGANGYDIYMATSKTGKYSRIKTVTSGSTIKYTKSSLTKNKKYYFKVRAYRSVSSKKIYSSFSPIKYIVVK